MSKLLTMLGVLALALSISGIATAADDTNTNQQNQQPPTQTDAQQAPATIEQRELEYLAAVNKCERITNDDEKQKCFGAARTKHGEM